MICRIVRLLLSLLFFFSSRRRHTRWPRDWSSDVCSSDLSHSKPQLAGEMLERLGGEWDNSCWSSGYTVTLEGLNRLLLLASVRLGVRSAQIPTPAREAQLLLEHLAQVLGAPAGPAEPWSGRSSVERMLAAGYRHARHTEWAGWFFEFLALDSLIEEFGGGPHVVEPVTFDYKANYTWDLKTHSRSRKEILLLNDQRAINTAVSRGSGLGDRKSTR